MEYNLFTKVAAAFFFIMLTLYLYRNLHNNPDALSIDNLSKSLNTMGIVAIFLVIFVGMLVFIASS